MSEHPLNDRDAFVERWQETVRSCSSEGQVFDATVIELMKEAWACGYLAAIQPIREELQSAYDELCTRGMKE